MLFTVKNTLRMMLNCGAALQRLVKRSTATLQKREYQLLYCDDGVAAGSEMEALKIMGASEHYGF